MMITGNHITKLIAALLSLSAVSTYALENWNSHEGQPVAFWKFQKSIHAASQVIDEKSSDLRAIHKHSKEHILKLQEDRMNQTENLLKKKQISLPLPVPLTDQLAKKLNNEGVLPYVAGR